MGEPTAVPRSAGPTAALLAIRRGGGAILIASALAVLAAAAPAAGAGKFKEVGVGIEAKKLFDLGVVDIDGDRTLDIFSTNHKFLQTIRLGDGRGFDRRLTGVGLDPVPSLPGIEDLYAPHNLSADGLHIWIDKRGQVHLVTRDLGTLTVPNPSVSLELEFYAKRFLVKRSLGAEVNVDRPGQEKRPKTKVSVKMGANAEVVLEPPYIDLPFTIDIEPLFPRSRVFVGASYVHPPSHHLDITLRDRHGIAWADANGDGRTDAFIATGGLHGTYFHRYEGVVENELLIQRGDGTFANRAGEVGLRKGLCRSRQSSAIDFNRDGNLDLFSVCQADSPQLFLHLPNNQFRDDSAPLRGTVARGTAWAWVDLRQDHRPELVGGRKGELSVYTRRVKGDWDRIQRLRALNRSNIVARIAPGAIDGDSDVDLFVAAKSGNTVALNRGGELRLISPRRYGLPAGGSLSASFVDYDNDGRLDLHLVPQGLFKRKPDGTFRKTGLVRGGYGDNWAIDNWADFDNDGDRDALIAIKRRHGKVAVKRFENRIGSRRHWLELELQGSAFNREAVGARVKVKAGGRKQFASVGDSEGSRFSQGHYRLYFGLGRKRVAKRVNVTWPNGSHTRLKNVRADRLLELAFSDD